MSYIYILLYIYACVHTPAAEWSNPKNCCSQAQQPPPH